MPSGIYKHPKQCGFQKGHLSYMNEYIKDKISKAKTGIPQTEEHKKKVSEWHINHPNKKFSNTKIEQKIAKELNKRGIYYQQNIGLCNIANVDFYLPEYRTVIECDGCYYHGCLVHHPDCYREVKERDRKKTELLMFHGFNVYRFWEHEINKSAKNCINTITL